MEKDFMLLFSMPKSNQSPTAEQIAAMHQSWGVFIGGIAAQAKLVSTYRLGFEGTCLDASLNASESLKISDNQMISGNMIIKAKDIKEASAIAKDCPVLKMGGSVEIRNIIPMEA